MNKLYDYASILRSKNAGPLYITFDIMFDDVDKYEKVKRSDAINKDTIAKAYDVNRENVEIYIYDLVTSIKITIPRKIISGDLGDDDIYGCQQHIPLSNIAISD